MSKHTPGPWKFHGLKWKYPIMGPNQEVIVVRLPVDDEAQSEANAYLIAAAPEMLIACERAIVAMDDAFANSGLNTVENESYYETYQMLKSAIAKARGES